MASWRLPQKPSAPLHWLHALGWYRLRAYGAPLLRRHFLNGSLASFREHPRQLAGDTRSKALECEYTGKSQSQTSWNTIVMTVTARLCESAARP